MKKQTQNKQNSTPYTTDLSNWRYCGEIADVEKSLTRQFMTDLFDKKKMSVTKVLSYYVVAHWTPADMSMLSEI